jgi:hypothetical protein
MRKWKGPMKSGKLSSIRAENRAIERDRSVGEARRREEEAGRSEALGASLWETTTTLHQSQLSWVLQWLPATNRSCSLEL